MRVTLLGTGTAIPEPQRFPCAYLVQSPTKNLLVDCGPGILRRMASMGVGLESLDALLLTHFHTDHTADVAALLFALRNQRYHNRPPLPILGGPGLAAWLRSLAGAWRWVDPELVECGVQVIASSGEHFDQDSESPLREALDGFEITAVPVTHTPDSLAFRFEHPFAEGPLALSGDADVCPGLETVARDAEWFICDAAFPSDNHVEGHLTPKLAAEAATRAGAKRLILTHFYPECDAVDVVAEAQPFFDGEIIRAEDGMQFEL